MKANYKILTENESVIVISDADSGPSVAENPEGVIKDLDTKLTIGRRKVVFQDATGVSCGVLIRDGAFAGFELFTISEQEDEQEDEQPIIVDIGRTVDGILSVFKKYKTPPVEVIASMVTVIHIMEDILSEEGECIDLIGLLNTFYESPMEVEVG